MLTFPLYPTHGMKKQLDFWKNNPVLRITLKWLLKKIHSELKCFS